MGWPVPGPAVSPSALTAVLFLAVFGGAPGHRIHCVEGIACLSFILPGLVVLTVAARAFANCSASVFQATNEGYAEDGSLRRFRPWQFALSYMSGGLLCGLVAVLTVALVPLPGAQDRGRRLAPSLDWPGLLQPDAALMFSRSRG